jgi:membrane protease YdiL (CAAX protease family)
MDVSIILLCMVCIVVLYWPFLMSAFAGSYTYPVVKLILFLVLPVVLFTGLKRETSLLHGSSFGLTTQGLTKSLLWFVVFLPIMLVASGIIQYVHGMAGSVELTAGTMSFFEAFTEEFFFRGILFIFLFQRTTLKIAYATSLMSFILMHPQNLTTVFIGVTIIQGFLTVEIARKSHNIVGSWLLHGSNRFVELVILPLFL